ncbi:MAG: hypothetical protein ACLQBD_29740 [Syntrophobacteraceae bacterium]
MSNPTIPNGIGGIGCRQPAFRVLPAFCVFEIQVMNSEEWAAIGEQRTPILRSQGPQVSLPQSAGRLAVQKIDDFENVTYLVTRA